MPRVSAVVTAAGLGTRMQSATRKPYLEVGGRPILLRALEPFAAIRDIAEIIVVAHAEDVARLEQEWREELARLKVKAVCAGGERRQDSVWAGVLQTSPECDVVLIHDAVRPLVHAAVIRRTIAATLEHGAAIVAARVKETVKEVDASGRIVATRPREGLWLAQTPQGFRRGLIIRAHERVRETGAEITDDAQAVELLGEPVAVVEGDYDNIKITTPRDLAIADALAKLGRG